jgi:hypothetical protein
MSDIREIKGEGSRLWIVLQTDKEDAWGSNAELWRADGLDELKDQVAHDRANYETGFKIGDELSEADQEAYDSVHVEVLNNEWECYYFDYSEVERDVIDELREL